MLFSEFILKTFQITNSKFLSISRKERDRLYKACNQYITENHFFEDGIYNAEAMEA